METKLKTNINEIVSEKNKVDTTIYLILKYLYEKKLNNFTHLKAQKLFYYIYAWKYTFTQSFINDVELDFQAWIHGPVNYELYKKLNKLGNDYFLINDDEINQIKKDSNIVQETLPEEDIELIEEVLKTYGSFTGGQLEHFTHEEDPWTKARGKLHPSARSTNLIQYDIIKNYYESINK